MIKRSVFVFAMLFALCVSAYTQGDREALASIDGDGGGTQERTVPSTLPDAEWHKPNVSGKPYGISSMVGLPNKEGRTELLVVHDDDSDGGPRLGILTVEPNRVDPFYRSLNWLPKDDLKLDLEAISAVPDQPGQFLALSSEGHLFLLKVSGENATVVTDFMLTDFMPPPLPLSGVNIEGLSVQKLSGQIVINPSC